ncbi:extracellular solute-binding protein [Enterococcus pseudoavium]|uniref:Extracellular solute-binding protein n=2 Tax=Enterococcus pseudoavium TaxID=44007 RepID=A0AAE4KVK8_9ENTE|nr:extracellular solute-binding protein [Enterococcus pseudoavium]MDT2735665.1 extracellular solute-binding protein [Enterococcus pseudoavium]
MKMKRLFWGATLGLLALTLGACGGNSAKDGEVTVEFMHSSVEQDRLKVINQLVTEFEKENPDIKIKQMPVEEDAYNTKVVTLARSNKLPAVIEVSQDFAKVMDKDQLIDKKAVGKVMKSVGEENYYDGAKKLVRSEDGSEYIATPITGWVQGIWYSKKALADAGFSEPTNWEAVLKIAKQFNDPKNKKYGIAMPTADGTMSEQAFSQFALSNDANVLNSKGKITLDTPQMTQALDFYQKLSQYTMPGSNDVTEIKDAFMNGSTPMAIYSTYILPSVYEEGNAEDIGFAIPTNKQEAVYGTVSGLTISNGGLDKQQKAAAEKFVEFISEEKNLEKWVLMSPGGAQPINKKVVNSPSYQANEVISAFGELPKEIADSFDKVQVFGLVGNKNFTKMGDITSSGAIPKAVNDVTVGNETPKKALKAAQKSLEE